MLYEYQIQAPYEGLDKTPSVFNKSESRNPKSVYFNSTVKFYEGGFSEGNYNGKGVLAVVSL